MAIGTTGAELSGASVTNASTYTIGPWSPTANRYYILTVGNRRGTTGVRAPPSAVSGNNITWNLKADQDLLGFRNISAWVGKSSSPTSGNLTVSFTTGRERVTLTYSAVGFSGVATSAGTTGAVVQVGSTEGSGTTAAVTLSAFGSTKNATFAGALQADNLGTFSAGTGFTELAENGAEALRQQVQWRATPDTSVTVSLSSAEDWAVFGLELLAAATSGSTGSGGAVTCNANVSVQFRPEAPAIASAVVVGSQATVKITPSTEGWPARWYQKKASATTYILDGMSTAGTTSWVYYNLAGLTNYDLGVSHYNTTGRVESVWDTTSTNVTVSTLGARRVSGRVVG